MLVQLCFRLPLLLSSPRPRLPTNAVYTIMAFLSDTAVDELMACRTLKGQLVTVPGFLDLTAPQQGQIITNLRYLPTNLPNSSKESR